MIYNGTKNLPLAEIIAERIRYEGNLIRHKEELIKLLRLASDRIEKGMKMSDIRSTLTDIKSQSEYVEEYEQDVVDLKELEKYKTERGF